MPPEGTLQTGLDRIAAGDVPGMLRGRRLGLLAHPASVDADLRHARAVLSGAGLAPVALFGPEHGFDAAAQDMIGVASSSEQELPVYSLYGERERDLHPRPEWLSELDAVVIDLQDVGSRYYTYVWTAVCMLRAAVAAGVQTIVLDRPNPLGGERIEGRPQRPGYTSFVGLCEVPVRHGMTIGEICRMVVDLDGLDADALAVVEMRGWQRAMYFDQTGLPWVLPSPNMPTLETALVYPGGCLLEGTNLSEGRGCTRPFEIWGAPWLDGAALARDVAVDGALLRPLSFSPTFHKHAGQRCGGVQVHVTDRKRFAPYSLYLRLIAAVRAQVGAALAWRTEAYEFVEDRPAIDLLTGGPEYRTALDAGSPLEDLLAAEQAGAAEFDRRRQDWLLY